MNRLALALGSASLLAALLAGGYALAQDGLAVAPISANLFVQGDEILAELLDVDGAASLLDADLLDGVEGAGFALVDLSNVTSIDADTLDGIDSGAFALASDYEAADILALLLTVDGAASTLDADTLDGLSSAAFALAADVEAGDLLALLVTVDGTGSLLDADLLDGLSSAAFALADLSNVATVDADTLGGNATLTDAQVSDTLTCSAVVGTGSTSGAVDLPTAEVNGVLAEANGGTGASSLAAATIDADTVDGIEGAALVAVAGDTMTGSLEFSGVTNDVAAATGEDYTVRCGGTSGAAGACLFHAQGNSFRFVDSGGSPDLELLTSTSQTSVVWRYNSTANTGALKHTATDTHAGSTANIGNGATAMCATESISFGGGTDLHCAYGGGAFGIPLQQSITISTGDDTTSPTSSQVELSCTSAPCTYKPGETSVVDGWQIDVCNVDASDNIDVASAAGTVVVTGSPVTLAPGECLDCTYSGAIWGCR